MLFEADFEGFLNMVTSMRVTTTENFFNFPRPLIIFDKDFKI